MAYEPAGDEGTFAEEQRGRDRRAGDRRRTFGRRDQDRQFVAGARIRTALAAVGAVCGGLVVLYFFLALAGAFEPGDAVVASVVAIVLSAIWLAFFIYRIRSDALRVQRPDRERRGF